MAEQLPAEVWSLVIDNLDSPDDVARLSAYELLFDVSKLLEKGNEFL